MANKQGPAYGVRASPADWEMFAMAAKLTGQSRNRLIVEAAKEVALKALSGVLSRQRESADNADLEPVDLTFDDSAGEEKGKATGPTGQVKSARATRGPMP